MTLSEQLDQFIERGAVKYYYVETATQEEKSMYRQISIIDYKAGQASLKPIVLKLVEALNFYAADWGPHHGNDERTNLIIMETLNRAGFKARESLAEVEQIIGGGK